MAMAEQARARAARRGGAPAGSQHAQDCELKAQACDDLDDRVSPAEIDRVLAMYRKNAEPDMAARVDRAMVEDILKASRARIRENTGYDLRVRLPRELVRAYCLPPV